MHGLALAPLKKMKHLDLSLDLQHWTAAVGGRLTLICCSSGKRTRGPIVPSTIGVAMAMAPKDPARPPVVPPPRHDLSAAPDDQSTTLADRHIWQSHGVSGQVPSFRRWDWGGFKYLLRRHVVEVQRCRCSIWFSLRL